MSTDYSAEMPKGFPLPPIDAAGETLRLGDQVQINSVASCAKGLPLKDQERLHLLVGEVRKIVAIDRYGFVWLCFNEATTGDFSLFPAEVSRA